MCHKQPKMKLKTLLLSLNRERISGYRRLKRIVIVGSVSSLPLIGRSPVRLESVPEYGGHGCWHESHSIGTHKVLVSEMFAAYHLKIRHQWIT